MVETGAVLGGRPPRESPEAQGEEIRGKNSRMVVGVVVLVHQDRGLEVAQSTHLPVAGYFWCPEKTP